jgi:hypothetical protein
MNTIILFVLMFSYQLHAQLLPKAPAPLTDSKIERTLDDGKKQEFDGNEWMIVKRHAPSKPKPAVVCAEPTVQTVETVRTERVEELVQLKAPRNSLMLLGGRAPYGLSRDYMSVKEKFDAVGGAAYQRRFGDRYLWQLQGLSNESVLGAIGIEY